MYYIALHYVMLCYVMLCCYVILCYIILYYVILCYIMLYYVILCYTMLCYVMLCYVILCYIILYYIILYYIILYYVMLYWKTEEALAQAAVTLETERIKGSNPWYLWWWWWWWWYNNNKINKVNALSSYFLMIYFNNILPPIPKSTQWPFSTKFRTTVLCALLFYTSYATFPAHIIHLHFISLKPLNNTPTVHWTHRN